MRFPKSCVTLRILTFFALMAFTLAGCGRFSGGSGPRRAARLAARAIHSLGGARALNATRFLVFDYTVQPRSGRAVVTRSHTWDRQAGRYRLEGATPDGQPYVALFNVETRQGQVFAGKNLQPLADSSAALQAAYRDYLGDTAWLLGVFRLRDPGVQLDDAGQQVIGGRTFDVISAVATGPAAGKLPGRQNWIYLDPESHRPFAWSFIPEGNQPRVTYLITAYQPIGQLNLPSRLDRADSPWSVVFTRLFAPDVIGDNVFESLSGPMVQKVRPLEPEEQTPPR